MKILVNGASHDIVAPTLDVALNELGYAKSVVATALNGEFVAAHARSSAALVDGDRLEIVAPTQGG